MLDAGDKPRVGFALAKHGGKASKDGILHLAAVRPSVRSLLSLAPCHALLSEDVLRHHDTFQ